MAKVVVEFQIPLREDADKATSVQDAHRKTRATAPARKARRRVRPGALHPPFRWKALQDALTEHFEGWTLAERAALGEWKDPDRGSVVRERSRVYRVDVPPERLEEIKALLRRACVTFVQKCIRVVIHGEADYLREGPDEEPL